MKNLISFLFLLGTLNAYNQGFRETFTEANLLTEDGYYGLSIPMWETLVSQKPENANLNYKLGKSYISQGIDRTLALPYLEAASLDIKKIYDPYSSDFKSAPVETYFYLGLSYQIIGRLDEAEKAFNTFLLEAGKKHFQRPDAERCLIEILTAREMMANPIDVSITNLGGPINSQFAEYSPIVAMDENTIYFTSRRLRPDSTNKRSVEPSTGLYFEDMYVSYRNINGKWMNPELLNINIPGEHSSVVSMGDNGRTLFIYRIYNGVGNIYQSHFELGTGWTIPELVGSDVNSSHNEYFATLSSDQELLYFVSDRPGGFGGKDIWYVKKLPNGDWGKAINLGAPINSPQDEDAPFIHPDGKTLYFSSNGHKTMGGYDIFYSQQNEDNSWSTPTNMGYPINTTDNDHSLITTPSGRRAYYSSRGSGSLGSTDIYVVDFAQDEKNFPEVDLGAYAVLKGFIFDPTIQNIPENLQVKIANNSTGKEVGVATPVKRNGSFVFIIPPGETYKVSYLVENEEVYSEVIVIPYGVKYQEINREIYIYTNSLNSKNVIALSEEVLGDVVKWRARLIGENKKVAIGSKMLYLDGKGNAIDTVYISKDGYFEYKNLGIDIALKPLFGDEKAKNLSVELMDNNNSSKELVNIDGVFYEKNKTSNENSIVEIAQTKKENIEDSLKAAEKEMNRTLDSPITLTRASESKGYLGHKSAVTVFLDFNQIEMPIDEPDFTATVSNLAHYLNNNYNSKVRLIASASHLPTSKFSNNQELAEERLEAFEAALKKGLLNMGLDINKISTIERKAFVSGPTFEPKDLNNKGKFIEFQYITVEID